MFGRDPVRDLGVKYQRYVSQLGIKKGQESVTAMIGGIMGF